MISTMPFSYYNQATPHPLPPPYHSMQSTISPDSKSPFEVGFPALCKYYTVYYTPLHWSTSHPPTTPTCSRISNCSAVATANDIYTLLIAALSLAGVPCLASSLSSAYTPGWCLRISSGEGRCEKLGVKRGRGSYFCSIICFFIFISRPAALARRAGVKRGLAGCEKAKTLDGTLNSSLNQVFHLGAVLKAMTNQNWEIECKGTESFRMCRSKVCKREVRVWLTPGSTLSFPCQYILINPLRVISFRETRFSKCFRKLDCRSILGISWEQHESSLLSISVESKVKRERNSKQFNSESFMTSSAYSPCSLWKSYC